MSSGGTTINIGGSGNDTNLVLESANSRLNQNVSGEILSNLESNLLGKTFIGNGWYAPTMVADGWGGTINNNPDAWNLYGTRYKLIGEAQHSYSFGPDRTITIFYNSTTNPTTSYTYKWESVVGSNNKIKFFVGKDKYIKRSETIGFFEPLRDISYSGYLDASGNFSKNKVTALNEWVLPTISGDLVTYKPGVYKVDPSASDPSFVHIPNLSYVNTDKAIKCVYKIARFAGYWEEFVFDSSFSLFTKTKQYVGVEPNNPNSTTVYDLTSYGVSGESGYSTLGYYAGDYLVQKISFTYQDIVRNLTNSIWYNVYFYVNAAGNIMNYSYINDHSPYEVTLGQMQQLELNFYWWRIGLTKHQPDAYRTWTYDPLNKRITEPLDRHNTLLELVTPTLSDVTANDYTFVPLLNNLYDDLTPVHRYNALVEVTTAVNLTMPTITNTLTHLTNLQGLTGGNTFYNGKVDSSGILDPDYYKFEFNPSAGTLKLSKTVDSDWSLNFFAWGEVIETSGTNSGTRTIYFDVSGDVSSHTWQSRGWFGPLPNNSTIREMLIVSQDVNNTIKITKWVYALTQTRSFEKIVEFYDTYAGGVINAWTNYFNGAGSAYVGTPFLPDPFTSADVETTAHYFINFVSQGHAITHDFNITVTQNP